jgi:hypothetical protein
LVFEQRWVCHRSELLLTELKYLEQSPLDGKVDHPKKMLETLILEDGTIQEIDLEGTKDLSDGVCGSVVSCLRSNERPMDTKLMSDLLRKTAYTRPQESRSINDEDITKILPLVDGDGRTIIGTKDADGQVNKISEIFRRLNNR